MASSYDSEEAVEGEVLTILKKLIENIFLQINRFSNYEMNVVVINTHFLLHVDFCCMYVVLLLHVCCTFVACMLHFCCMYVALLIHAV